MAGRLDLLGLASGLEETLQYEQELLRLEEELGKVNVNRLARISGMELFKAFMYVKAQRVKKGPNGRS